MARTDEYRAQAAFRSVRMRLPLLLRLWASQGHSPSMSASCPP